MENLTQGIFLFHPRPCCVNTSDRGWGRGTHFKGNIEAGPNGYASYTREVGETIVITLHSLRVTRSVMGVPKL